MRRLWALPSMKPVERKRYVFVADDLALMLGVGALTGGGSALAGMMGNKNRKGGGTQVIYPKQYSWTEPRLRLTNDFITQNLQRIQEGKFPAWYEGVKPILKQESDKAINKAYYGDSITPGALKTDTSYAVARGLGRGGSASNTHAALLEKQIDDYINSQNTINKLGYDAQQQGTKDFPQMAFQQNQAELGWGTPVGMYQQPYEQNGWDSASAVLGQIGAMVPWLSMGTGTGGVNKNAVQDIAKTTGSADLNSMYNFTMNSPGQFNYTGPTNWSGSNVNFGGAEFSNPWSTPASLPFNTGWNPQPTGARPLKPWVNQSVNTGLDTVDMVMNPASGSYETGYNFARKKVLPWLSSMIYQ